MNSPLRVGEQAIQRRALPPDREAWLMRLLKILPVVLLGFAAQWADASDLRFSLVKTAQTETQDHYAWRKDGWQQPQPINHVAVLVEYQGVRLLFGTGLGSQINAQLDAHVPWRTKRFGPVHSVRDQLQRDGLHVDRILLACARWAQASGLADFPDLPVLVSADGLQYARNATPPAVLPSQFQHGVRWQGLRFDPMPYQGFSESLDIFGDGRLVLVPLSRHGAMGLFLTLDDGRRFFFGCDALEHPQSESMFSSQIIQAEDAQTQARLGFYPVWIK